MSVSEKMRKQAKAKFQRYDGGAVHHDGRDINRDHVCAAQKPAAQNEQQKRRYDDANVCLAKCV